MIYKTTVRSIKSGNAREEGGGQGQTIRILSNKRGFTMVELLITMVVFVFVMAAASQIFSGLLTQFKQQSKIAETNIEGAIGLEIMRRDVENAGYGLPFQIPVGLTYNEAIDSKPSELPFALPYTPSSYNEATLGGTTTNPPRGTLSGDGVGWNGSDVLVIKAANVSTKPVSHKWTYLTVDSTKVWKDSAGNSIAFENFDAGSDEYIIALATGHSDDTVRSLLVSGGDFSKKFSEINVFDPPDAMESRFIYGINDSLPRMPFNRADYFIVNDKAVVPQRCIRDPLTGTPLVGVLYKGLIDHSNGALDSNNTVPLLDCVADMQIIYRLDMNDDGRIGTASNADGTSVADLGQGESSISPADVQATFDSAEDLRRRLKEIRVYILAHEGQKDTDYQYPNSAIALGEFGLEKNVVLGAEHKYYRWKLYTITVNPLNLR